MGVRSRARAHGASGAPPLLEVRELATAPELGGLRGVGFGVRPGEAVALFGPGARTVLAVLAGRTPLTGGAVLLDGAEQPRGIGVGHPIGPSSGRSGPQTTEDHLRGRARMRGDARAAAAVLDVFPMLRARARSPLGALTDGEHRLLGLAEALLSRPRLLLIDGLTPGLAGPSADTQADAGLTPGLAGPSADTRADVDLTPGLAGPSADARADVGYTPGLAGPSAGALADVVRRLLGGGAAAVLAEPMIPVALSVSARACVLADGRVAAELAAPRPAQIADLLRSARPTRARGRSMTRPATD
ncbi:ATP-binding cassette domain-containing protein [Spirillospora sp. NPDC048819]|uniref:ATP-binding cassette domain-containing protein n=1 Tax=Spirillospora sp. NPDC048819 TaxID=3155268 RepID=UPI0033CB774C